jgi:hypothetical protein
MARNFKDQGAALATFLRTKSQNSTNMALTAAQLLAMVDRFDWDALQRIVEDGS